MVHQSTVPVTRQMVATRAKVSTAVVSYVVNNGPRPVAAATRARVLQIIDELGYRPNGVARALRLQRTTTYGLLVPDNSNPYFAELAKAVEDAAFARQHALVLCNSSNDPVREQAQLRALSERQVDGLLLISADAHPDLSLVSRPDLPVVLLDRLIGPSEYPSVSVDNRAGAYEAVQHLLGHGHTQVAYIAGPGESPAAMDRESGWRQALEDAGVGDSRRIERAPFSRRGGYQAAQRLLGDRPPPTAIFAASDLQAVGALRACHEAGLTIPGDLAVVAFDGTQEAEFTIPPLSVIAQPIVDIADTAIRILSENARGSAAEHHTLPHRFIARESCGCSAADLDQRVATSMTNR